MLKEIEPTEVYKNISSNQNFTILDIREYWEVETVSLKDPRVVILPMSIIGQKLHEAFPAELRDPEMQIVVMCHHGSRSASVAMWMSQNGWNNVWSLAGGIDAYAAEVDPTIGYY